MPNDQDLTVTKKVTVRVTHTHDFDDSGFPDGECRCGHTAATADGPVMVTEASGNA